MPPNIQKSDPATPSASKSPPVPVKRRNILQLSELTDQTNLLPFRKLLMVFLGLSICVFVSTLDQTVVATALPSISSTFHAGSLSSFVPSIYLLTSAAFQPLYGRFSDIFGRKLVLCVAMGVYVVGNLAASFSKSILQVVIFRGLAGAGEGGIVSLAQIIIADVVSLRERGKYQGVIGFVVALGDGIGPVVGGILSEKASWRWCFRVTLPPTICAIIVVSYVLPLKPVTGNAMQKLMAIDFVGTGLSLAGSTLVMLPLIWGGITFPWSSAPVLGTLIAGLIIVPIFCIWEWKGATLPIIPMHIFKHATVTGAYTSMFVNGFISYSLLFYLPQFSQVALGYSPIRAGVFLLPLLVSETLSSLLAGVIVSRTGRYRINIYTGFSIFSIGCGLLSTIKENTSKVLSIVYLLITGIGSGQTYQITVAAQASVSRRDMSVVTAVLNFLRLLGGTLSVAVGSSIINNSLRDRLTSLKIPAALSIDIINDPIIIYSLIHPNVTMNGTATNVTGPALQANISVETGTRILDGYNNGVRGVFILNAALAALCVVISAMMIKHKELVRADEADLKKAASESTSANASAAGSVFDLREMKKPSNQ